MKQKAIKSIKRISLWRLLIFALAGALVVGYFNHRGFAYLVGDPPTAPTNLTASFVNSNEVQISWGPSSSSSVSTLYYSIYRNNVLVTTTTALTYYNSGLLNSTTYTYYVTAHDQFGTSPASNSVSITTPAPPPPPNPSGLTAKAVSTSEIDLSWTGNTLAVGYMIFRNTGQINTTGPGITTYKDTGLAAGTTYSYYVEAYYQNPYSVSGPSNTVSATTLSPPPPPTAPANLTAETLDDEEIDLSWTASTSSTGISNYNIYRNGSFIGSTSSTTISDTGSSTAYYDSGLASATSYSYYVVAIGGGVASNPSNSVSAKTQSTTPPSAPTSFKATVTSSSTVSLSWTASVLGQVGVKEYDIYKVIPPDTTDDNGVLDGTMIGSTTGTSYQVSGLAASTSYGFYVIAVDTTGNSSEESTEAIATTNATGYAINVSTSASVTDIGNNTTGVVLNWAVTPSSATCTRKFASDGSATDPSWTGSFSGLAGGSQVVYPPSSSMFYTFYSYELSCTNGSSTAVSGIDVRSYLDSFTN